MFSNYANEMIVSMAKMWENVSYQNEWNKKCHCPLNMLTTFFNVSMQQMTVIEKAGIVNKYMHSKLE